MTQRSVTTQEQADRLARWLVGMPLPYTVTVREGEVRSLNFNALLHKWFAQIARQLEGETMYSVKGACNHKYGLPIRLQDQGFEWLWSQTGGRLSYERQVKILEGGYFAITSAMTNPELKKYMDAMQQDYAEQGVYVSYPEASEGRQ